MMKSVKIFFLGWMGIFNHLISSRKNGILGGTEGRLCFERVEI